MEKLLLAMMDHGLLLYEEDGGLYLMAVNTPAKPNNFHFENGKTYVRLMSLEDGLLRAKRILGLEPESAGLRWEAVMMYKHRALGVQRSPLGIVGPCLRPEALVLAEALAQKHIAEVLDARYVERHELKLSVVAS